MSRPPKPTALKLVTGNPGKRKLNKQEPDPEYLQNLAAPAWLSPEAAAVWNEKAPELARHRLLTVVDTELLAHGCVAMAQYRMAVAQIGHNFVLGAPKAAAPVEGSQGDENAAPDVKVRPEMTAEAKGAALNPWMVVQSMAFKQAREVFRAFGMSPLDRTRIALQPQGDLFDGKTSTPAASYFS